MPPNDSPAVRIHSPFIQATRRENGTSCSDFPKIDVRVDFALPSLHGSSSQKGMGPSIRYLRNYPLSCRRVSMGESRIARQGRSQGWRACFVSTRRCCQSSRDEPETRRIKAALGKMLLVTFRERKVARASEGSKQEY